MEERRNHKRKHWTDEEIKTIIRLYTTLQYSSDAIAKRYKVVPPTVRRILVRAGVKIRSCTRMPVDISQEEIARRAAQVRQGWDEETYRKRAGLATGPFEFPTAGGKKRHNGSTMFTDRHIVEID